MNPAPKKKRPASAATDPGTVQLIHLEGKAMNNRVYISTDFHDATVNGILDLANLGKAIERAAQGAETNNALEELAIVAALARRVTALADDLGSTLDLEATREAAAAGRMYPA